MYRIEDKIVLPKFTAWWIRMYYLNVLEVNNILPNCSVLKDKNGLPECTGRKISPKLSSNIKVLASMKYLLEETRNQELLGFKEFPYCMLHAPLTIY